MIMQSLNNLSKTIRAVKSVVEMMIKIIEERDAQDYHDQLVRDISIEVFNDTCSWVSMELNLLVGNRHIIYLITYINYR